MITLRSGFSAEIVAYEKRQYVQGAGSLEEGG